MEHESWLRLSAFLGVFFLMATWEMLAPKRTLILGKKRWLANIGIVVLDSLVARILLSGGAVTAALWAESNQIGILRLFFLPDGLMLFVAVVVMDFIIYAQHVLFHRVPMLWRLHQVHHADRDIDVTTGLRFHPIEIILSMLIKITVVIALGVPVLAVVVFEVILNGMAMFNHANVRLPKVVDGLIRLILVTPDVHRVHHSMINTETNRNYGFNLSIWDRLFGTYQAQPRLGHEHVVIGLPDFQRAPTHQLFWMLRLPFQSKHQKNKPANKV
ncbi:MAG: sterol desaturase family protein [Mariprofundaceae bacterium]|nr:sterol desaturase family protein [Mariprofundaceae bacterium]